MPAAKPNKRITRVVYGSYVALTTVFVGLLIVEVSGQVFAEEPPGAALSPACASGIKELYGGVDRGIVVGLGAEDVDLAVARYRQTRDDEWKGKAAVEAACAADPRGSDAMAALARLDRQAEAVVRKQTTALRAVRREVDSFIR